MLPEVAHPVDQGEGGLNLGALVAGIAVLLDPESPCEVSSMHEPPLNSQLAQAPGELQADRRLVGTRPSVNRISTYPRSFRRNYHGACVAHSHLRQSS